MVAQVCREVLPDTCARSVAPYAREVLQLTSVLLNLCVFVFSSVVSSQFRTPPCSFCREDTVIIG